MLDASNHMRTSKLASRSKHGRSQLLRRLALKSDEMISKALPIVEDVRARGNAAFLELTAKLDEARLSSMAIFSPFAPETMPRNEKVWKAIRQVYAGVTKFHDSTTLRRTV